MSVERVEVDVAIVGAGISGLTAAHRLTSAGVDSLIVLEARDRVGGRTKQVTLGIGDRTIDGGGELIGSGQDALYAILSELGIGWYDTYFDGLSVYSRDDERGTFQGLTPPLPADAIDDQQRVNALIDELAATVPLDAPWDTPNAAVLDRLTLAGWMDANVHSSAGRKILNRQFANAFGMPASLVSFLWAVFYMAGRRQVQTTYVAATHRIEGGANNLSRTLAARLGQRVRLSSPILSVDQSAPECVTLRCPDLEVTARRVIVAMAPADCRSITFNPPLPAQRTLLQNASRGAPVVKFHAVYREPFWRAAGYNGYAYLDLGNVPSIFDCSPPDGSVGILMAWLMPFIEGACVGDPATIYDDADARREAMLDLFASLWGEEARAPLTCVEVDWMREPYSLGCEFPAAPGVLTTYGPALKAPVDRVHWGSAESGEHWVGYMCGAVESGERTAREVLARL